MYPRESSFGVPKTLSAQAPAPGSTHVHPPAWTPIPPGEGRPSRRHAEVESTRPPSVAGRRVSGRAGAPPRYRRRRGRPGPARSILTRLSRRPDSALVLRPSCLVVLSGWPPGRPPPVASVQGGPRRQSARAPKAVRGVHPGARPLALPAPWALSGQEHAAGGAHVEDRAHGVAPTADRKSRGPQQGKPESWWPGAEARPKCRPSRRAPAETGVYPTSPLPFPSLPLDRPPRPSPRRDRVEPRTVAAHPVADSRRWRRPSPRAGRPWRPLPGAPGRPVLPLPQPARSSPVPSSPEPRPETAA